MKHDSGRPISLAAILSVALFQFGGAQSAFPQIRPQQGVLSTTAEFAQFADKVFAEQMERLHIPGAVFVLVKDGHLFYEKGYGYADLTKKTPVSPQKTIFRLGSVTKTFTATAMMQLTEAGKVNLADDVNRYLQVFTLENNYPKPVTIDNLLTHTGGFDEQFIGKNARTPAEIIPLDAYLARRMPPRIMPPGEFISYSNHGYALLGYVVQLVSGLPFDEYIGQHILRPLGMMRSSVRQPLPSDLRDNLAVGYVYRDGVYQPASLDYFNDAPAGSLVSTGEDMARFMVAQLENGQFGDARILNGTSVKEMQRQHFTPNPKLPGVCYGFWEYLRNNERAIQHDGGWTGFFSLLFLLPEHHVGFFLATNSLDLRNPSQQEFGQNFVQKFLDGYYPSPTPIASHPPANLRPNEHRFAGDYLGRIPPRHTFERVISVLTQTHVSMTNAGRLAISSLFSDPSNWVQVEPLVFEKTDGRDFLAFRENHEGKITHMFDPEMSSREEWYDTGETQMWFIACCVLVFLSTQLWPLGYLRRIVGKMRPVHGREARAARILAGLTGMLNVAFLVGLALALQTYPDLVWYGVPAKITLLLLIPCFTTMLTLLMLISTWQIWHKRNWSLIHRCHYTALTLVSLIFVGFLLHWNLLGFLY